MTIANGATNIGEWAFYGCEGLVSLTIPPSVKSIGEMALFRCSGLKTLSVPAIWKGTQMLDAAIVPAGCSIVYEEVPVPEETTTTPVAVPFVWLEEKAPRTLAAKGGNYEATALAVASNRVNTVWECYVEGVEPEDAGAMFKTEVSFVDGVLNVTWKPDLGTERKYKVEGVECLGNEWGQTNAATRFFRAKVSMP